MATNTITVYTGTALNERFLLPSDIEIIVRGGGGDDRIVTSLTGAFADLAEGGDGADDINTAGGDDVIFGDFQSSGINGGPAGPNGDLILAGEGADIAFGQSGNDYINGEDGDDALFGGDDDDHIFGGMGSDQIFGGAGNDRMWGGSSSGGDIPGSYLRSIIVTHDGPTGDDIPDEGVLALAGVFAPFDSSDDRIDGGDGDDQIFSQAGNDVVVGGAGDDYVLLGNGADAARGDDGDDQLSGQAGVDVIEGNDGDDAINGGSSGDMLSGGAGSDIIYGDDPNPNFGGADNIDGGDGHDLLYGFGGDDVIFGGAGNDYLVGHAGFDTLRAQEGYDYLNGGDGVDHFVFDARGFQQDEIQDFEDGVDKLVFTSAVFTSFDQVEASAIQQGLYTFIIAGGGDYVVLTNFNVNNLTSDDVIFS